MKKLLVLILSLTCFVEAQTIAKKKSVDIVIVDELTVPDSTDCKCKDGVDGKDGLPGTIGLTGPKGDKGDKGDPGQSIQGPQGIQSIQGIPGVCPSCPTTGGSTTTRATFDVYAYGAKGDGITDDRAAFQSAIDNARAAKGTVVIPPASNFFKINGTINVIPDGSNQIWVDIKAKGRAGEIRYAGRSNTAVFKIIGLKGALWEGLNVAIENGRTGCQIFDIDTTVPANSSSFNTFKTFYMNLGDGANNIGIRTGKVSGGGADISNYTFENMIVYGGRTGGYPGQYAFQNLGHNTLSMTWYGGFVAGCDRVYANRSADGSQRGNGSVAFYGLGGSGNNIDFEIAFEQTYIISGGRWENGNKFLKVTDGAYSSVIVQGLVIHDYKDQNNIIEANVATSITLDGVHIAKGGGRYNNVISLNANGRFAALNIQNSAFSCNTLYKKTGSTQWDITATGNVKLDGLWSNGFFNNEIGVRK